MCMFIIKYMEYMFFKFFPWLLIFVFFLILQEKMDFYQLKLVCSLITHEENQEWEMIQNDCKVE